MTDDIQSLLYNIEEEDLILLDNGNSTPTYNNNYISIYAAEYNDTKVNFIVYNDDNILDKEIKERFKHSYFYFPSLLGICTYSSIGTGLIFERPTGPTLASFLSNTENNIQKKAEILINLINMFDFNTSRGVYLGSLRLEDIVLECTEAVRLRVNKYPIFFSPNCQEELLSLSNQEIMQLSPDMLKKCKETGVVEINLEQESWLLGVVIYEFLEGKPFVDLSSDFPSYLKENDTAYLNKLIVEKVIQLDNKQVTNILNILPYNQYLRNVLKKLLKVDKKQRIGPKLAKQLLNKNNIVENIYSSKNKSNAYQNLANSININESNINIEQSIFDVSRELNFNVLLNNESIMPLNKEKSDSESKLELKEQKKTIVENTDTINVDTDITKVIKLDLKEDADDENNDIIHIMDNKEYIPEVEEIMEGETVDNVNLLLNDDQKDNVNDKRKSDEILKELFHMDQNKSYMERLEKLAKEYSETHVENYLLEIKDLVLKKDVNNQELEIYDNISPTLFEALTCIAFELLENDDIKSHYIFTNILYSTIDKTKANNTKNLGIAKFHYAMSMKDYCNNYSLSLNLFLESIALIDKAGEGDTQLGVQIKYYLGNLYDDMGMCDESIKLLREVLDKQKGLYGEEHIYTARTYNCLGIAEDNRGNLRQAKDYYQKAYGIFKYLSFGLETIDSVKVLNNLAGIFYKWEDYSNCVKYYMTVLDVYKNKYGETNSNIGVTYNNLSNCYSMLDNNDKALFYLKKSVEIFNSVLGSSHIQTAMAYKNLGDLYLNMEDKKNSLEMFTKCVDTFLEKFGEDNDLYISTLSKIKKIKNK
jgi:hypothetical protein